MRLVRLGYHKFYLFTVVIQLNWTRAIPDRCTNFSTPSSALSCITFFPFGLRTFVRFYFLISLHAAIEKKQANSIKWWKTIPFSLPQSCMESHLINLYGYLLLLLVFFNGWTVLSWFFCVAFQVPSANRRRNDDVFSSGSDSANQLAATHHSSHLIPNKKLPESGRRGAQHASTDHVSAAVALISLADR